MSTTRTVHTVTSPDGTQIAYQLSGDGPPLVYRPRRDLGSRLLACRATRARGSLPRLRAGAAWPRPQRRHAAVRDRARVRGHRRAGRVHRRAGVSARAFLRCDLRRRGGSAGGRSARARPLRAALRPERLRLPARIHRQPRGAARRRRSCGSDPEDDGGGRRAVARGARRARGERVLAGARGDRAHHCRGSCVPSRPIASTPSASAP